jgi:hypothetical protein
MPSRSSAQSLSNLALLSQAQGRYRLAACELVLIL